MGTANLVIPMKTLSASGASGITSGIAELTIPMRELYMGEAKGVAHLTIPMRKVSSNGYSETVDTAELTIPMKTLVAYGAGVIEFTIPMKTLIASGRDIYTGKANLVIPMKTVSISGWQSTSGTAYLTIPMRALVSSGDTETKGTATLIIPMRTLKATERGLTYKCIVVNLMTGAVTEYNNFSFDKLTLMDNEVYGSNSNGIYLLGGDSDIASDISASFQTFLTDYDTNYDKNLADCVIGLRSDGQVIVESIYSDATGRSAIITSTSDIMTDKRASLGRKGTASRFVGNKITNVSGSDFSIESIYQELLIHKRGKKINE